MELGFRFDSVWVLESLPADDLKTGESLYRDIIGPAVARWPEVTSTFRSINSKSEFLAVLDSIEADAQGAWRWPIIHLETHGNAKGLGLASGEFITWAELREPLTRINRATRLNLVVTLAACSGAEMRQVLHLIDQAPFLYVSGPSTTREAGQLLMDFGAFYQEVLSSLDMRRAFDLLNGNERPARWVYPVIPAEYFFRCVFEGYVSIECTPDELRERENAIVAEIGRRQSVDLNYLAQVRLEVRAMLRNQEPHFDRFRRRFFMIDEFPENDNRFTISWSDLQGQTSGSAV